MAYTSSLVFFNATTLTQLSGPELASELVTINNLDEADDDLGGVFAWNPSSEAVDDATNVFQPNSVTGPGRWIRVSGQPAGTSSFSVPITFAEGLTADAPGTGATDIGAYGVATGSAIAVEGDAVNGFGVYGFTSGSGHGGYFEADGTGYGAIGDARVGTGIGVKGLGGGSNYGVEGIGGATGEGVHGVGGSTSGAGGVFTASAGDSNGVTATAHGTGCGVLGTSGAANSFGVKGSGVAGTNNLGLYGTATGGNGAVGAYCEGLAGSKALSVYSSANVAGEFFADADYAVVVSGDVSSPVRAALRIVPQDNVPSGASLVGDIYVTTAGVLKICTVAGTGGGATWVSVGAQS